MFQDLQKIEQKQVQEQTKKLKSTHQEIPSKLTSKKVHKR